MKWNRKTMKSATRHGTWRHEWNLIRLNTTWSRFLYCHIVTQQQFVVLRLHLHSSFGKQSRSQLTFVIATAAWLLGLECWNNAEFGLVLAWKRSSWPYGALWWPFDCDDWLLIFNLRLATLPNMHVPIFGLLLVLAKIGWIESEAELKSVSRCNSIWFAVTHECKTRTTKHS